MNHTKVQIAIKLLREAVPDSTIILFGSQARDNPRLDSDLDFLVIKSQVNDRRRESVELLRKLEPFEIPADILVIGRQLYQEWKNIPGTVIYEANREGIVVYDAGKSL